MPTVHELITQQARLTPENPAVIHGSEQISYLLLEQRANQLAHYLREWKVGPEVCVGICMAHSIELAIGIVGILKAGGAYVLLELSYSDEQMKDYIINSGAILVVTQQKLQKQLSLPQDVKVIYLEDSRKKHALDAYEAPYMPVAPENLACINYATNSTDSVKGIQITHQNIVSIFAGLNQWFKSQAASVWLTTTSIPCDISLLELLWTLIHGFPFVFPPELVLAAPSHHLSREKSARPIDFSLFYFASNDGQDVSDKYRLLLEGAKFADTHGFTAIWTPERHFHAFGGLYPNPSILGAAIASVTKNVGIRAGSIVLPLHHPVRVAEEWAVIDNLSHGRVGISFASGWHTNDFIFAPEHYEQRKKILFQNIETVRHLWRGGSQMLRNGADHMVEVKIYPQPVQPDLPVWVTAASHPDTFRLAAEVGANILTHLLNQNLDDLAKKIALYRRVWLQHGHQPGKGHVTLMLHTFVGNDMEIVRETVRVPFINYLRSSVDLTATYAQGIGDASMTPSEADMEALAELTFERHFKTSGLFGTPESCIEMIERLRDLDIDEIACLIDFGVETDAVLESLHLLDTLRAHVTAQTTTQIEFEPQLNNPSTITIDDPIITTTIKILDQHYQLVPTGMIGEVFIGGMGVARGYHNHPELTAERFLPDPFSLQPGARLYRTGDKARTLPNGSIEILSLSTLPKTVTDDSHSQMIEKASSLLKMSQYDEEQMVTQINQLSKDDLDALLSMLIEKKPQ